MGHESLRPMRQYQPEAWRNDADVSCDRDMLARRQRSHPDVRDQSLILELLGRINYRIVKGDRVYVETGGVVYKTLYGGYWRSVFTGIEHYLLKCERVSGSWRDAGDETTVVELPIVFSQEGWSAKDHSLSFMLSRD